MFHNSHRYFTEILELVRSLNATQNDPQPPSTTPNESLRLVGGFYSTLPFMSPSTTPNVSFRHVGGFLRPLALDHGPIDPQRVISTRWGLSSSPGPRPRPHRPPTCRNGTLGASSCPQRPSTCHFDCCILFPHGCCMGYVHLGILPVF